MAFNLVGFSFAFAHKEDLIPRRGINLLRKHVNVRMRIVNEPWREDF